MASSAAALLLRAVPLLRVRALRVGASAVPRRYASALLSDGDLHSPAAAASSSECDSTGSDGSPSLPSQHASLKAAGELTEAEFKEWKNKEKEILEDIKPITSITKEILHSVRYMDGECLSAEDEMFVREKLLCHHPRSDEKIGRGLHSIVVDRHPEFRCSRCLFVVSTDGALTDFSYRKCLKEYIRNKYPSHAERFIRKRF